jgi:hypothetical protein
VVALRGGRPAEALPPAKEAISHIKGGLVRPLDGVIRMWTDASFGSPPDAFLVPPDIQA